MTESMAKPGFEFTFPGDSMQSPKPLSTLSPPLLPNDDGGGGPSWGLIIPIIMIGLFLLSVVLCLWWHKWRDKRQTLQISRSGNSAFSRSYRSRGTMDSIRDSTRSTTPLRSSLNEKTGSSSLNNMNRNSNIVKVSNVNVIPIQQQRMTQGSGKYSFYWEKNHWKAYPTPPNTSSLPGRMGTKPLSPINEIDSPSSLKLSDMTGSYGYNINSKADFSPYHIAWNTPVDAAPPTYKRSDYFRHSCPPKSGSSQPQRRHSSEGYTPVEFQGYEPAVNSPFFPNNNTPTTECGTGSEASREDFNHTGSHGDRSSQFTSYPSTVQSASQLGLSVSLDTETTHRTSCHDPFFTSREDDHSALHPSSTYPSGDNTDHPSTNLSSLPSSIARFRKQGVMEDVNNNSAEIPDAYLPYPGLKMLNYTLASSVASTETSGSDYMSLLPNVGSSNTSGYPTTLTSRPQSMEPSGQASPEDLSKLVDEMSSIRPVEESSSVRPQSLLDPSSRIISISEKSVLVDQRHWSALEHMERLASTGSISSQNGSMYWDNFPLPQSESGSLQGSAPLQDSLFFPSDHTPVLMDTQYWV